MKRVLLLAAVFATMRLAWHHETRYPVRSPEEPARSLVVPPGANAESIGHQLEGLGLVRHSLLFRALVLARGAGVRLKAGEYALEGPLSLDQIVDLLERGEVVRHELTFPEGKSLEEMAELAALRGLPAALFRKAARDPSAIHDLDSAATDLEGYLFPDTYDMPRGPDAATVLVARMVQRFREVMAPDLPRLPEQKLDLRQVVTLASLVELETAQAQERPRIAAVFLNRLKKGMLLQTDPTVIYALRQAGTYDGNIRKKDLDLDSPYNTYRHAGLPPGPIGSPGREALQAVLRPAEVKDLYFVSRNDGTHQFSETLAEHERAVDRYQRRRSGSAAAGKASRTSG